MQIAGLSILAGAHRAIEPRVMVLLREKHMEDVVVVVGATDPGTDAIGTEEKWRGRGVTARFIAGRDRRR